MSMGHVFIMLYLHRLVHWSVLRPEVAVGRATLNDDGGGGCIQLETATVIANLSQTVKVRNCIP